MKRAMRRDRKKRKDHPRKGDWPEDLDNDGRVPGFPGKATAPVRRVRGRNARDLFLDDEEMEEGLSDLEKEEDFFDDFSREEEESY